ncbi:GNAT family N-acetyltransferase [Stappia sp. F7233]|uniref:GNAT family N-acetyltransferase n=1 Tax=Stappia albiluteola TaxID=2758565 RepID=A0A839AE52_9HYPH|nr:GNAT family N-acetyltransferase [Stappia albiluteola]MBA5777192.1 GNAT family N-acetyltransferase [Stappia albiluteola]
MSPSDEIAADRAGVVSFRMANAEDATLVHGLLKALAGHLESSDAMSATVEDIRTGLAAPAAFSALIAERSGDAVGLCLWFPIYSTWRGRRGMFVQDIYVAESERASGLGRRLLAEAGRIGARDGASFIRLAVDAKNRAAQRFYDRLGFTWFADDQFYDLDTPGFTALVDAGI